MYTASGDNVKAASYFKQVTDSAKWDVAADDNLAGTLLSLDNPTDAKKYIDLSVAVSNGTDTPLLVNQAIYAFETGDSSWKRSALADNSRPDGHAGVICGGENFSRARRALCGRSEGAGRGRKPACDRRAV
jgi:hypothetical protein